MISLIKKELKLTRKILLIWLGIIILLCVFAYIEYLSLKDSLPILVEMLNDFPRILMVMFGVSEDLNTALGWYGCIYFWVAILAYSYAIYLGISSIAKEKTQGTAEYLFTKPLGRNQIIILDWFLGIQSLQILQTGYAFWLWRFNSILLYLFCGRIFVYSGSVLFNTSKIL